MAAHAKECEELGQSENGNKTPSDKPSTSNNDTSSHMDDSENSAMLDSPIPDVPSTPISSRKNHHHHSAILCTPISLSSSRSEGRCLVDDDLESPSIPKFNHGLGSRNGDDEHHPETPVKHQPGGKVMSNHLHAILAKHDVPKCSTPRPATPKRPCVMVSNEIFSVIH